MSVTVFKLADGTTKHSSLIGCSHHVFEVSTTAQGVTIWQSSLQNCFQRGSGWKSMISGPACLTYSRSMARTRQMSQMSPHCRFCGLSRWPGQITIGRSCIVSACVHACLRLFLFRPHSCLDLPKMNKKMQKSGVRNEEMCLLLLVQAWMCVACHLLPCIRLSWMLFMKRAVGGCWAFPCSHERNVHISHLLLTCKH